MSTADDQALNNALKEVELLRLKLSATERRLCFVIEVQKYNEQGQEARRKGLSEASAPFALSPGELHMAYREAWMIGWRIVDEEVWLRRSTNKLQRALSDLLMARKIEIRLKKGKAKRKLEPKELEAQWKRSWVQARETMKEVNGGKTIG